ncbi:hypothetical protein [Amycolatopsis sp. WGS_07]|uniref:scabin-related ADP-ribosyltransferase n=1 Tax=Amycolatopsis sp. WGS_07 TaxID=3076764 RepID=UPI003872B7E4
MPESVWRTDRDPLYRLDDRTPAMIFEEGLKPWDAADGQYDLKKYVAKNQPSPFVSTTYDRTLYQRWNKDYVYEIDAPGGIKVNATIGQHKFFDQNEVAFPGGLDRRFIVGAREVESDGITLGPLIENPALQTLVEKK